MLLSVTLALATGNEPQQWLANALLESFVIHFRALSDFFYPPENARPDDVLAVDYFDDPMDWNVRLPPLSEALARGRIRAHKEIAHLTYARLLVTSESKPWEFAALTREISALMTLFRESAPPARLGVHP